MVKSIAMAKEIQRHKYTQQGLQRRKLVKKLRKVCKNSFYFDDVQTTQSKQTDKTTIVRNTQCVERNVQANLNLSVQ